jgi:hypothetical protein
MANQDSNPSPKPRFRERKARDDEAEFGYRDTSENSAGRSMPADRPPLLFIAGLILGALSVTTCCGLSGWWMYAVGIRGGSFGSFSGNQLEIVSASRTPGFGQNAGPQVGWKVVVKQASTEIQTYSMVMECGSVTYSSQFTVPPDAGSEVSQSLTQPIFKNTAGPFRLWVERRSEPNKSGARVSNIFVIR